MRIAQDIHSLSDFKRKTTEIHAMLRSSGRPVILTLNGRAEFVVQSVESYQRLMDYVARLESETGIRRERPIDAPVLLNDWSGGASTNGYE